MIIPDLPIWTRRAIFEAMVAMAWADTRIEREEVLAIQAAGRVLDIPEDVLEALDAGAPRVEHMVEHIVHEDLSTRDKELVYICAAWLSTVDAHEDIGEAGLLHELQNALAIEPKAASALRDTARELHIGTPSNVPWWEELERLIEAAAKASV